MRTHYSNLKIAEDAPIEVVRAAYRALSQRYHPDKNPGNARANEIMQIINAAYATLSDPFLRLKYDDQLARTRATENAAPLQPQPMTPRARPSAPASPASPRTAFSLPSIFWFGMALAMGFLLIAQGSPVLSKKPSKPSKPIPAPQSYAASSTLREQQVPVPPATPPPVPAYMRAATAPNGRAWPVRASYLPGYELLASGGRSSVLIDNSRNSSDVLLKLVSLDYGSPFPVRVCFIPGFSQFRFLNVAAGNYDVRYRDLDRGNCCKTDSFTLHETRSSRGTRPSNISLTLYKVGDGKMKTFQINESEF